MVRHRRGRPEGSPVGVESRHLDHAGGGEAGVGADGFVQGLIEKPDSMENNLAVVGIYYFKRGEDTVEKGY